MRKVLVLTVSVVILFVGMSNICSGQAHCLGGLLTIVNNECERMYIFVCYGPNGAGGSGATQLARGQSTSFNTPDGSSYSKDCAIPASTCPATYCVNGRN